MKWYSQSTLPPPKQPWCWPKVLVATTFCSCGDRNATQNAKIACCTLIPDTNRRLVQDIALPMLYSPRASGFSPWRGSCINGNTTYAPRWNWKASCSGGTRASPQDASLAPGPVKQLSPQVGKVLRTHRSNTADQEQSTNCSKRDGRWRDHFVS